MFDPYKAITSVLDEMEFEEWRTEGVEANLKEWRKNKAPLIELLRKHPQWNEEVHAIIMTAEIPKPTDKERAAMLLDACRNYANLHVKDGVYFSSSVFTNRDITEDMVEYANHKDPVFFDGIRAGAKTSRFLRNCFRRYGVDVDSADFMAFFGRYADEIATIREVNENIIISVNPGDYLSMSYGNSWASCHIINPCVAISKDGQHYNGCYRAGTISYMNDAPSLVLYSVHEMPETLTDLPTIRKYTRQMFHVNIKSKAFIQSRLYPLGGANYHHEAYRNIMMEVLATCFGVENNWNVSACADRDLFQTMPGSLHYPDYFHAESMSGVPNNIMTCVHKDTTIAPSSFAFRGVYIGNDAFCMGCGDDVNGADSMWCSYCNPDGQRCADCGNTGYELYYCEDTQDDRCEECSWVCEDCGRTFSNETEGFYVEGLGRVCPHCMEDHYSECDICGELVHNEDILEVDDRWLCNRCFDEHTFYCEHCDNYRLLGNRVVIDDEELCEVCAEDETEPCTDCGAIHLKENMVVIDGMWVCEECEERRTQEAEAEEEEEVCA